LTKSREEADHWRAFSQAKGVLSKRWKQTVSLLLEPGQDVVLANALGLHGT